MDEEERQEAAAEEAAETTIEAIADILNTPVKIIVAGDSSGALPDGLPTTIPILDSTASSEQLRAALQIKPPNCAGIAVSYVCGNGDA